MRRAHQGPKSSYAEVAAGRLDAGGTLETGSVSPAQISDDLGEVRERVELPVKRMESTRRFRVLGEPGVTFLASGTKFVSFFFEVADGLVEAADFRADGLDVGGFGAR
jgi:hypothetical protein